jgi:hypothetical protein
MPVKNRYVFERIRQFGEWVTLNTVLQDTVL